MVNFDVNVQQQLIVAVLDDFCANAALPHLHGGQFGGTPDLWRASVVRFLDESLRAGLIEVLPTDSRHSQQSATEICRLLMDGKAEKGLAPALVWEAVYFQGTEKLRGILRELQLDNWEAMKMEVSMPLVRILLGPGAGR
jgi:hypothetical protein